MSVHEVFPYLRARSAEKAIAFYVNAFGATEKFRLVEPGGRIGHAELMFGQATIMISDEFPEFEIWALDPDRPSGFVLHLHVDNADAVIAKAVEAGGRTIREAQDHFYGERSGTIRDPFGYDWMIGHSIEDVELGEMQRRYEEMYAAE
jgi:PhnB protein